MTIKISIVTSFVFTAAIFGFFYAWVCSTMWGLDTLDPRVAMSAMQAMNASVRNAVFFPAFFLTPVVLLLSGFLVRREGYADAAMLLFLAAAIYLFGGFAPTALVNVPMNETLGALEVPTDKDVAAAIWEDYSPRWQFWNIIRTLACLVVVVLVGWAALSTQQSSRTAQSNSAA